MGGIGEQLRSTGLRNTPSRRAVLIALAGAPHATAAEVAADVAEGGVRAGLSRHPPGGHS